jgi:hypothetical protein
MKRTVVLFGAMLLLAGIASRVLEARGLYRCEREEDPWCKRPGFSLFRWVIPRWHKVAPSERF